MTRATNAGTGVTRYLQVYTVLSQALAEGDIAAGEALPSEPSLVRQYGVSRTTVRRALARLAAERYIVRRRGSGTFARDNVVRADSARQNASVLDKPHNGSTNTPIRTLDCRLTASPDFLRREWPEFGPNVLTIRGVQYVDHEAVALLTAYVPEEIGKQLNPRRLTNDTVLEALDKLGIHATSIDREVTAVGADPLAAQHLDCGVGAPILNLKCLARDAKGRIVRYANYLYRPDRYEIHTVVERDPHRRARQTFRL